MQGASISEYWTTLSNIAYMSGNILGWGQTTSTGLRGSFRLKLLWKIEQFKFIVKFDVCRPRTYQFYVLVSKNYKVHFNEVKIILCQK